MCPLPGFLLFGGAHPFGAEPPGASNPELDVVNAVITEWDLRRVGYCMG